MRCYDFARGAIVYKAISEGKKVKIKPEEVERGGGIKIPLERSIHSANYRAYRRLSGLIGFRRPFEFGLYRPRLIPERPGLARPTAYRPAYERPGPLGTLGRFRGEGTMY